MSTEEKRQNRENLLIRMDERWKFVQESVGKIEEAANKQWTVLEKHGKDIAILKVMYKLISALWFALLGLIGWKIK
jgi:hypothetical protein